MLMVQAIRTLCFRSKFCQIKVLGKFIHKIFTKIILISIFALFSSIYWQKTMKYKETKYQLILENVFSSNRIH